jgi:hypothetical protein
MAVGVTLRLIAAGLPVTGGDQFGTSPVTVGVEQPLRGRGGTRSSPQLTRHQSTPRRSCRQRAGRTERTAWWPPRPALGTVEQPLRRASTPAPQAADCRACEAVRRRTTLLAAVSGCASHLGPSPPQSPAARPAACRPLLQHTHAHTSSPSLHAHAPPTPTLDAHDVVCRVGGLERRLYTRSVSARTLPWHRQRAATRKPRHDPSMSDPECLSALRASGEAAQPMQGTHAQPRPAPGAGSSRR